MKRSSPAGGFSDSDQHFKRQKVPAGKHHHLSHLQPGASIAAECLQDGAVVDNLLRRAITVALYSTGFDSVHQSAMEGYLALVESYMTHFSQRIAQHMALNRRAKPLPQDFIHALSQFGLVSSALEPHLNLPLPSAVTQPPLFSPAPQTSPNIDVVFAAGLGDGDPQDPAIKRSYIPKHFPSFPSQHAYKDTPTYTKRELDATTIREHATQEGVLAEQALRKLMIASKKGAQVGRRRGAGDYVFDTQRQRNEEVWRETLAALAQGEGKVMDIDLDFGLDGVRESEGRKVAEQEEEEAGAVVNYDWSFWRQGARDRIM